MLDFDGRIELVNPAAARSLGLSAAAARGRRLLELDGALVDLVAAAAGTARVHTTGAGGKIRILPGRFTDRGHERRFLLLEEMTEEVRAAERAAYEKLIRMVAHEVGNSVAASSSLLQSSLAYSRHIPTGDSPDFEEAVGVCLARLATLNGFVRDLAEVCAPARAAPPALRPRLFAARRLAPAPRLSVEKAGVEWELVVDEPLPLVTADRAQIEQAFLNIAKNAIEAAGPGGRVFVSAARSREGVDVLVENSSSGLAEDVQARLFTPFFSTKADGRGLGLTLVREILVHHRAPFALTAPAGGPTRFVFSLRKAN